MFTYLETLYPYFLSGAFLSEIINHGPDFTVNTASMSAKRYVPIPHHTVVDALGTINLLVRETPVFSRATVGVLFPYCGSKALFLPLVVAHEAKA